jgi:hypothetical protein
MHRDEIRDRADAPPASGDHSSGVRAIAHQLNNTLVPLLALGSLLAETLQDAEAKRDMDQWVASAVRARDLVRLLFVEADRLDGSPEPELSQSHPTDEVDAA